MNGNADNPATIATGPVNPPVFSPGLAAAPPETAGSGPAVTVDLIAKNMVFSTATITAPAGTTVQVNFHNQESPGSSQVTGIAHNFAVYDSPSSATALFSGEIITGGSDAVYRFTAPSTPGTYFFRDDANPLVMNGSFIVQ